MVTALFTHPDFDLHIQPPGHPEQVARLAAVAQGLATLDVQRLTAPMGTQADILRCHPAAYIARVKAAVPAQGWASLDGDTYLAPGSYNAAVRAVGAACAAVDLVLSGGAANAFVACRPPGHHAERETAMGFCLFGTVAIAAKRALQVHGLSRVAILDFDVHHGNGTQDLVWDDACIRFISSHEMPLYPGTGHPTERGAHGQITNLPLHAGSDGTEMQLAWEPALDQLAQWHPDLVLISAGFDAHASDPLASLQWKADDFTWLTNAICDLAENCCQGRVVSCLEGGYDLHALTASVRAHVSVLQERGR